MFVRESNVHQSLTKSEDYLVPKNDLIKVKILGQGIPINTSFSLSLIELITKSKKGTNITTVMTSNTDTTAFTL